MEQPKDELGKQVDEIKKALVKLFAPVVAETFEQVKELMTELPSSDVVEVLYCKDCVYYSEDKCLRWADGTRMKGNDYCSRGARKDGE